MYIQSLTILLAFITTVLCIAIPAVKFSRPNDLTRSESTIDSISDNVNTKASSAHGLKARFTLVCLGESADECSRQYGAQCSSAGEFIATGWPSRPTICTSRQCHCRG